MTKLLNFPTEVNDTSARIVATGAVLMAAGYAITGWSWLLLPLTYGFLARVASGPTFSPLARLATQVITPRLPGTHRIVPGPPKRFAQGIGALFSVTASVLFLLDFGTASRWVAAALAGPAFLEAAFGFCVGCKMFAGLMKIGVIPESVCVECSDISARLRAQGVHQ
ncbi:MAG: DUF4395 domain-containing protein [Acidimicrobiaceae bacterium]|nr:DUF4395 domain-containing protein [Ilumatobacteraceae bacterium]